MAEVFEGDEWKRAEPGPDTGTPKRFHPMTRAEAQAMVDDDYGRGLIDLECWRVNSAFLSEPTFTSYDALLR